VLYLTIISPLLSSQMALELQKTQGLLLKTSP